MTNSSSAGNAGVQLAGRRWTKKWNCGRVSPLRKLSTLLARQIRCVPGKVVYLQFPPLFGPVKYLDSVTLQRFSRNTSKLIIGFHQQKHYPRFIRTIGDGIDRIAIEKELSKFSAVFKLLADTTFLSGQKWCVPQNMSTSEENNLRFTDCTPSAVDLKRYSYILQVWYIVVWFPDWHHNSP